MFKDNIPPHVVTHKAYSLENGKRIYVIGDVHGCLNELNRLTSMIEQDIKDHPVADEQLMTLIYIGDYIDRGLNSKGVLDFIIKQQEVWAARGRKTVYLRGNHEQGLLDAFSDDSKLLYRINALAASYGVNSPFARPAVEVLADLKEKMPPEHLAFLESTQMQYEEDDYFFVHAGISPEAPLDAQNVSDMLMIRDDFLKSDKDFGVKVVFGHSLFENVRDFGNKIGVDTAAFSTGKLSAVVLEGKAVRVLHT